MPDAAGSDWSESEPSEFDFLAEAAAELGLDTAAIPPVSREFLQLPGGQQLSYLRWGTREPELVLLHGGGQNAHTWDLVLLLLGRPAIAIDLPGHGHSDWRSDRDYGPLRNAEAIAAVVEQRAPDAEAVVGMSLGGLSLIHLAATRPDLVRQTVLVDVAPGSAQAVAAMTARDRGTVELSFGPRVYARREEMIDAAVASSPRRPASAVRRGVIHNSKQLPDGAGPGATTAPSTGSTFRSTTSGPMCRVSPCRRWWSPVANPASSPRTIEPSTPAACRTSASKPLPVRDMRSRATSPSR